MKHLGGLERCFLAPESVTANELTVEQQSRARLAVCGFAQDAEEAGLFLRMLGLL